MWSPVLYGKDVEISPLVAAGSFLSSFMESQNLLELATGRYEVSSLIFFFRRGAAVRIFWFTLAGL